MSRKVIELKHIGLGPIKDYQDYAVSYREAADALVRLSDQPSGVCLERICFALVFLSRHSLELMLKDFINVLYRLERVPPDHTHKLDELWNIIQPMIKKHHDKFRTEEQDNFSSRIDDIDKAVEEFRKIDPDSFEFRYPTNIKGSQTLDDVHKIDLDEISEMVRKAGIALGGMASDIEMYFDTYNNMGYRF